MHLSVDGYANLAVFGVLILFSTVEVLGGMLDYKKRRTDDYMLEGVSLILLSVFTKPAIVLLVMAAANFVFPQGAHLLSGRNFWLVLLLFLAGDDFLQYWYHRISHRYPFFWKLHRPHHTAEEMGLLVSYRNAALYYILMPNIYWLGLIVFLGGGIPVAVGLVIKQIIIVASHSPTRWDRPLYRYKILSPVAYVVEHVFITPAFHYAHHGKSQIDNISDPNGNFGNMFSVWDQMFGTAKFTRQYPTELGLPNNPQDPWTADVFYPLVASPKAGSEISRGYVKIKSASCEPVVLELDPGTYLYCRCGYTANPPFCDGSHHGTRFKPLVFTVQRRQKMKLCNCKVTAKEPFCDNSHLIKQP